MNFKKFVILGCSSWLLMFTSCIGNVGPETPTKPNLDPDNERYVNDINPLISKTTSVSQDFIFNVESVGITTINIRRSEWNKMLSYFDYFYKNENNVIAESYEYEKDGKKWKLNTVGLRLRGNTSRYRPQGKDTPSDETGHYQMNGDWNKDYYNYAATCPDDDYRQSHFKIDFEPYDDDDRKMSDCMKGVALKRTDSYFSKEIFCYNLFHQYGIWTAPRASRTKVYINFIEDLENGKAVEDTSKCSVTKIDFGVYEMFEEVNKQSLKGRMSKKGNNSAATAWANNEGDLWKCSGGDLTATSNKPSNFGCEDIKIINADKPKSQWSWIWHNPCYDLKTNKSNVSSASSKFQNFLTELNNLSNKDKFSHEGIEARKAFYEKWFDVDFFIKTYAVNILVGMDDDYWGNANNYYLYFDNGTGGTGKCYLIPFDYDNTLGASITGDKVSLNPLAWGADNMGTNRNRPLLDRFLEVPEYVTKFKKALLEVSSQDPDSPWNKDNCIALWNRWKNQVEPYAWSPNLKGWPNIATTGFSDDGGWKAQKHYLAQDENNIYEQTHLNFVFWLSDSDHTINFDLNGGSINGETGTISRKYDGVNPRFDAIIGTPVRPGYEFLGWTKTKNGSDYTEKYNGEEDLTVYAFWVDLSMYTDLAIYEIKDDSYQGIKIGIVNLPENNYRRTIFINGKEVGADSRDNDNPKYGKIWAYPFTEPGKTYDIRIDYSDIDYNFLASSNTLTVTASSGLGPFKVINNPNFYIENNILRWTEEPVIQLGDGTGTRQDNNWSEYFLLEIQSTMKNDPTVPGGHRSSWNYQSWNYLGASCNNGFNFKDHVKEDVLNGTRYDLCFRLRYIYNYSSYGDLSLEIYDWNDMDKFNIQ